MEVLYVIIVKMMKMGVLFYEYICDRCSKIGIVVGI